MKLKVISICVLFLGIGSSWTAKAAQNLIGTVMQVNVLSNGQAYTLLFATSTSGTAPSCVKQTGVLVWDSTTAQGQSMVRMLYAAKLSNAPVQIIGDNTCTTNGAWENLYGIYL
jgi:hypothetical protein